MPGRKPEKSDLVGLYAYRNDVSVTLEDDTEGGSAVQESFGLSDQNRNEDRNDDTHSTASATGEEEAMTREDLVIRSRTRLSDWARIGALVDGARVCEDVLQDLEALTGAEDDA